MRVAVRLAAFTLLLTWALAHADPATDTAAPFTVRDENPLLAGFGLPAAMPSRIGDGWTANLDLFWGSTALTQERANESLLVDAETREARVTLQGAISNRIAWQVQIPYRYTGSGSLDGFIDSWHDIFSLAEGDRPFLPKDRMSIAYSRSGVPRLDVRSSASGLGDIQAALGYSLHASPASAVMAWLSIDLPTGDEEEFTSNGATDVSLLLSGQRRLGERWSAFGQVAGTWVSESDFLPFDQNNVVWSAMLGASVRAWRGLSFKAQLDAHTAVYDSELDFLREAVVLTVGGDYLFDSGWRLDLGVSEDLTVEHSPDVVFVMGLKRVW